MVLGWENTQMTQTPDAVRSLTSSFLLYMPVFAALAGGKVALYRPLE
jgi:hypothetical protein